MSAFDLDVSEILKLANDLENVAPKQMLAAAKKVTVKETKALHDRAKSAAPRDRPWLATQGLKRSVKRYPDAVVGTVYGVSDPRGRPVAFFAIYGSATAAPDDFLAEAAAPSRNSYPDAVLDAMDPLSGSSGGGDPGGDGGDA